MKSSTRLGSGHCFRRQVALWGIVGMVGLCTACGDSASESDGSDQGRVIPEESSPSEANDPVSSLEPQEKAGEESKGQENSQAPGNNAGEAGEEEEGEPGDIDEPQEKGQEELGELFDGVALECQKEIVSGLNTDWQVEGRKRAFYVDFPNNATTAPALVFSFHGFGDNPSAWRQYLGLDPNIDPEFPMIVVTPESTHLQPLNVGNEPQGLDWDLANGGKQYKNRDVSLVQSIAACLRVQNDVDTNRIYSLGFSAGSVFTSLLHSRFPHDFAAIVVMSGMWFNDPAERALINPMVPLNFAWDSLESSASANVLLSRGGPSDAISILEFPVVNLEDAAQAAFPFLAAAGRMVVDCPHQNGHRPSTLSRSQLVQFFKDHERAKPSPYLTHGLDSTLSAKCALRAP
ncbi:MAG TPA: PHB depolymerase family esterase [Polyangiaceae bacterium]|nr:MAG: Esterase PHB depolymerase [Deltaproteobacteria bacterium ADurb.Bin207]HNS96771.1 PHB depolymerase family esterase [Polyangiaceae bacterium]HNZ20790.1 PHB depolymerase family esterase [Polyangiaceae bacterium]HOD22678.1 PHB depolymerase family esterase [Polyangiaceae bacterium]HOE48219.1 PHB depolymerase family esterase [Polyangiaceae bacterium]